MKPKGLGRGLSALLPDADLYQGAAAGLQIIPIRDIKPNPHQPRRDFKPDELEALSQSIREKGVIQPLVVRRTDAGYELIAGERRLRAAKLAGFSEVPCRLLEVVNESDLLELSLIENLQRDDLNAVELAEGYRGLEQQFHFTQEQIAHQVGKDRTTVTNALRLLELPEPILKSLRAGEISAGHAKAILSAAGAARQSALWKQAVAKGLSVRQTEEAARGLAAARRTERLKKARSEPPAIRDYSDRLRRTLGTQVQIQKRGKKGVIRIEFYSEEDLERLVEQIVKK